MKAILQLHFLPLMGVWTSCLNSLSSSYTSVKCDFEHLCHRSSATCRCGSYLIFLCFHIFLLKTGGPNKRTDLTNNRVQQHTSVKQHESPRQCTSRVGRSWSTRSSPLLEHIPRAKEEGKHLLSEAADGYTSSFHHLAALPPALVQANS